MPVLITGEPGSGKTRTAMALHDFSGLEGPFIKVASGTLSGDLAESALVGYAKGTFTGATKDKVGYIEAADGGTLFIDEIADIPLATQDKLMLLFDGLLERKPIEFKRLGEEGRIEPRLAHVRLITATNKDIDRLVDEGRLRRDFVERIEGHTIGLKPLRERPGDITAIALGHAAELAVHFRGSERGVELSPSALDAFLSHPLPGNVRQLRKWVFLATELAIEERGRAEQEDPAAALAADEPVVVGAAHAAATAPKPLVIGAGLGGLAAALRLGAKGYRATGVDRRDRPSPLGSAPSPG